jgi:hypothetical protein
MKLKRILSSVSLVFVLTTTVFLSSFLSLQAQSYKKSVELNDSLVQFTQKKTFKYAGDKLMTLESFPDTVKQTQLLTIKLLNPDFSLFKTFSRELPIDMYIMYYHNGVDVMEVMENEKPVFYWRYSHEKEIDHSYYSYSTVLNEASDSLYSIPVSFHGAKIFENNGVTKIVGETVTQDTIHYQVGDWYGWYTMQVQTSSIYDLKTGMKECAFPKGTMFSQVAVVNDTARIYTHNDNMTNFLTEYHPMGSESTCMKALVYNMDYSVYKEMDYSFASIGLVKNDINYATLYQPVYNGKNDIYFLHSFSSYVKDEQGGILGYSYRSLLTDKNGALVKLMDNPTDTPSSAIWLPSRNESVFISYSGVVFSCPTVDSIGKVTDYTVKEDGSVVFVQVLNDSVRILNEQLNAINSFPALSSEWSLSDFSQKNVVADDLLDLVFHNNNDGVKVVNENGKLLVNEPDSAWKMNFMDRTPIFLMEKGHKYANLVDDSLGLWYRVAPLTAGARHENSLINAFMPISLQVYRQTSDSIFLVDSVLETGYYEGLLPEGTYFVRTVSDSLPSTYYPSALLWENATPIEFMTDSLPILTITQPANPQPRPLSNEGSIIGSLICDQPELLWAIEQNQQVRVYAVVSGTNMVLAVDSLSNMTFELNHLTYGSYDVLMDIPGKPMLNITTIMLYPTHKQEVMEFSLVKNGISVEVVTGLTKQTANNSFAIVPNPASDFIKFDVAFEGSSIELFDMTGRSVLSTTIQGRQVQVKQLPKGLYLVRVQSKEGVVRSTLRKK